MDETNVMATVNSCESLIHYPEYKIFTFPNYLVNMCDNASDYILVSFDASNLFKFAPLEEALSITMITIFADKHELLRNY